MTSTMHWHDWLALLAQYLRLSLLSGSGAITTVPDSGADEALAALDAAHSAFPAWRKVPAKQRAAIIKRWNDLVLAHQDDLGALISMEQGKPLAEGKGEVAYAASYIEWFAEEATRMNGEVIRVPGLLNRVATVGGRALPKWLLRRLNGVIGRSSL